LKSEKNAKTETLSKVGETPIINNFRPKIEKKVEMQAEENPKTETLTQTEAKKVEPTQSASKQKVNIETEMNDSETLFD